MFHNSYLRQLSPRHPSLYNQVQQCRESEENVDNDSSDNMRDMGHGHPGNQSSDGRTSVTTSGKYLQGEVLIKLLQLLQLFTERERRLSSLGNIHQTLR